MTATALTESQLDANKLNTITANKSSFLCKQFQDQGLNADDKMQVLRDLVQTYRDWKKSVRDCQRDLETLHEIDPRKAK